MKKILVPITLVLLISAGCTFSSPGVVGVIKTVDGGGSWQVADKIENAKTDISSLNITEMAFDPSNSQVVYAGAVNGGIWISKNSAQTWSQILSQITVYDFYVDPTNPQRIFASGIFSDHGKIVRTENGGASWEELYNEASKTNAVNSITGNPSNTNELYAVLNTGILIKSIDSGINWFVLQEFKDQALKVEFNPLNHELYVLLRTKGLAKSTDNGVNFKTASDALTHVDFNDAQNLLSLKQIGFVKLALDDQASGVMYLTTLNGLFKTTNDGANWTYLNIPVRTSAELPRAVASTKGGAIAYASIGSTIYKTLDGGQSWQTQALPTGNQVNKILIDPVLPQITYAGLLQQ